MNRFTLYSTFAAVLVTASSLAADIRAGLVSYWPLNTLDLSFMNTPDLVAGNHLNLGGIGDLSPLVAGKFGQAIQFDGTSQVCYYFAPPGEDIGLPIVRNPRYTVCLWVKGSPTGQGDRRYFCESSSANNTPLFAFGSQQYGTNASTRTYIRNAANTVLLDRQNITTTTYLDPTLDNTWHHIGLVYDGTCENTVSAVQHIMNTSA